MTVYFSFTKFAQIFFMSLFEKLSNAKEEKANANLKAGQDFLATNKTKPGIVETASGLQYEVIALGEGEKPTATQNVTCHYHGMLIDGTVFDSSVNRGRPATFPLNQVIAGWTEGLQYMPIGSKFRFFIPPHLGYGNRQVGPTIQANSTLIFDVELLGIS